VLRRQPAGARLPSAHDVAREFGVQRALGALGFPVPRVLALCRDPGVLGGGSEFYLMEHVDGCVLTDPGLRGVAPDVRRGVHLAAARTLAQLHGVRLSQARALLGEGFFPRRRGGAAAPAAPAEPGDYCQRQVRRWARQYAASCAQAGWAPDPGMGRLAEALRRHALARAPAQCLVHGDFRVDNLVLDPRSLEPGAAAGGPRVLAVLDWELSAVGDPFSDVAYFCAFRHMPAEVTLALRAPGPGGGLPEGIPREAEFVAAYCAARGCEPPAPADWAFYLGVSLFRAAAIVGGVGARAALGHASAANAKEVGGQGVVAALARRGLELLGPLASGPGAAARRRLAGGLGAPAPGPAPAPAPAGRTLEELRRELVQFMEERVLPAEADFVAHSASERMWEVPPLMEELKREARARGLWNLFLPRDTAAIVRQKLGLGSGAGAGLRGSSGAALPLDPRVDLGPGLTNAEYALLCEVIGRTPFAAEVFNTNAPDSGNMETIARYGTPEQCREWLVPLLRGEIRSCFAMTEVEVASSDATNMRATVEPADAPGGGSEEGGRLVLSGRKWWTSGAMDPRCKLCIFMGRHLDTPGGAGRAPSHRQHSMVLVPMAAPGVRIVRPLPVYGWLDAPHGHAEVHFERVMVPASAVLLGPGRGFEIAQGRLGPGRLHHCMRLVGMAERALELAAERAVRRKVFGEYLAEQGAFIADLAKRRIELEGARLLVLDAASKLDHHGNKDARVSLGIAKVAAPQAALRAIDFAVQTHGGAGVSMDTPLSYLWAGARTLRIADGPDEVHLRSIGKAEIIASKL